MGPPACDHDAVTTRWRGPGPEVLLALDRTSREALWQQVQRQLRDAIRSGRLAAGERLPSSRELARQLGVSRGVVVASYDQLHAEGYLRTRPGAAVEVARSVVAAAPEPAPSPRPTSGFDVDFEYGVPDLGRFPRGDWAWALGEACRVATDEDLGDEHGGGSRELRMVLAAYARRVRASRVDPDHVVVVPAFRHGLHLVLACMAGVGVDAVALEDPGPADHPAMVHRHGLRVVDVPVDEDGLDVARLARSGARAVVVTPAHQSPTGVLLSPSRRHALLAWARAVDGFVIEDDYDAEFRYDRAPVGSVQGLGPDRVIALGSVSKTLAPTIRIGWIAVPPALLAPVLQEKRLATRGAPGIDQRALALLIESGRFDRHIRRMRTIYARRREVLADVLARVAPSVEVSGIAAGCHAVVALPGSHRTDAEVAAACAERRVGVYPLHRYRRAAGSPTPPRLVLGFGNVAEHAIAQGLTTIGDLLGPS